MKSDIQGLGLGLRFSHFNEILKSETKTPWFEVIADDFLSDGPQHKKLLQLREYKPIVLHSIGMNLGGLDQFNKDYLAQLKELYDIYEPVWVSDHICWSAFEGQYHHDLLPIPRTEEALANLTERVNYLQDYFNRKLVLENITSYVNFDESTIPETQFLNELVDKTGCELLLDITNVLTNAENHNFSAEEYFKSFPMKNVVQIHLAGGEYAGDFKIDTHSTEVGDADIQWLNEIWKKHGQIPAMIERDAKLPSFIGLEAERLKIEKAASDGL